MALGDVVSSQSWYGQDSGARGKTVTDDKKIGIELEAKIGVPLMTDVELHR